MVKYAPRKVYIRESGGYVELSYTEFCRCRESDQTYMDKLFIPIQGCLLEVVREQYTDFYRDKERWRYLQKLDTKNRLLSLDGFTDSEGNPLDFITDEAVDIAETVVNAVMVDSLIPTGLSLFCGSQKIGKSWLMLKLCLCVSQGIPLWDMPTMEGDVLYLCLEDTFCRIQDRLFRLTDEASGRLHFAVASCKLSDGLIVQLEDYLKDYPDSRLIVIDTLQKVRTASKDNAYASDYGDISLIKDFADRHSLAVIVVHHIRKQNDSDVFNKVSGTTGLTGSADATFVLEKEKRASDTAKLYVTGRDTPYQEYTLRFRDCSWELVERKTQEQLAKETIPDVLFRLVDFMRDKEEWIGTATELLAAMGETETIPTVITKWLNEYRTTFLSENRICYQYSRRKDGRRIALARRAGDSGDGGDSDIRIPPCYCH